MKKLKILFVIKERKVYGTKATCYGLVNSCQFVVNALHANGIESKIVQVIDNNCIDREVSNYRPTHCFIEALWVVPSKFEVLAKLHPHVHWVIRLHSMIPFLVSEGMSFDWINEYLELQKKGIKISVSCNNQKLHVDLNTIYNNVGYTPNIYPLVKAKPDSILDDAAEIAQDIVDLLKVKKHETIVNIGCFGALRILKNHSQQAIWAIKYANDNNKILHFHVNVSNHETNETSPVLKNLHSIFKNTHHKLVEHTWMPHSEFLKLVSRMDLGLQISFTETFCIVAADFVKMEVPVIVSDEIDFIDESCKVSPSDPSGVIRAIHHSLICHHTKSEIIESNISLLNKHNEIATEAWIKLLAA